MFHQRPNSPEGDLQGSHMWQVSASTTNIILQLPHEIYLSSNTCLLSHLRSLGQSVCKVGVIVDFRETDLGTMLGLTST